MITFGLLTFTIVCRACIHLSGFMSSFSVIQNKVVIIIIIIITAAAVAASAVAAAAAVVTDRFVMSLPLGKNIMACYCRRTIKSVTLQPITIHSA